MSSDGLPELSVIVPVYNEEVNLEALFERLSHQRSLPLELIIVDGGSKDRSLSKARELAPRFPHPVQVLAGKKGRGAQMNLGAGHALAPLLLFLHADSSFDDPLALRKGVDAFTPHLSPKGGRVAGHFSLTFSFEGTTPLPFRYYERKARLDRPGCTHGDQGFLLSRAFFHEIGPFDETLPLMEDTRLAERIRQRAQWLLLPAAIKTSPRRFLKEGLLERQTLNAVLMNLAALGRLHFLTDLKSSYKSDDAAARLRLADFFLPISRSIAAQPLRERCSFWYQTGSYVRANAWQLAFFLDLLLDERGDATTGRFLKVYDRLIEPLTDNVAGRGVATALVWGWFRLATWWVQ